MNAGETHDRPGDVKHAPSLKITPKRIATQMRRRDALILRGQGLTYQRIADDLGYSSASEARKQILTAFAGVVQEPAQELLTLQLERLNSLLSASWHVALDPTASPAVRVRATHSAADIIDQISHLAGLVSETRRRGRPPKDGRLARNRSNVRDVPPPPIERPITLRTRTQD